MQNAGEAVAREIQRRFTPRPVTRPVRSRQQWRRRLCCRDRSGAVRMAGARCAAGRCRSTCAAMRFFMRSAGRGAIEPLSPHVVEGAELLVDALFGSGLEPRSGPAGQATSWRSRRAARIPIIAVDMPSGVLGRQRRVHRARRPRVCTVTFMRKKPGHLLLPGRDICGEVVVADIGIPQRCSTRWPSIPGRTIAGAVARETCRNRAFGYQQVRARPCAAVWRLSDDRRRAHGGARRGTHRRRTHDDCRAGTAPSRSMPPRSPASWCSRCRRPEISRACLPTSDTRHFPLDPAQASMTRRVHARWTC